MMEPLVLSEEEKTLNLDVGEIFLRRLIISGKKDCCWCELHLKCRFECLHFTGVGFYCNMWSLSKQLREILKIPVVEVHY